MDTFTCYNTLPLQIAHTLFRLLLSRHLFLHLLLFHQQVFMILKAALCSTRPETRGHVGNDISEADLVKSLLNIGAVPREVKVSEGFEGELSELLGAFINRLCEID